MGDLQLGSISVGKPSLQPLTSCILQHRRVSTGEKASEIVVLTPCESICWYGVFPLHSFRHPNNTRCITVILISLEESHPEANTLLLRNDSVSTDPTFPEAGAQLTLQSNTQSIAMQSQKVTS